MTIVEVTVAILVIAVSLFALAQLMATNVVATVRGQLREAAVSLANKETEQLRSMSYSNLKLIPSTSPAPPTTFTSDDGKTFNTIIAASTDTCVTSTPPTCVTYSRAVTSGKYAFTVQDLVLDPLSPDSGKYKKLAVQVLTTSSSAVNGPAFTYKLETIVHDTSNDPVTQVQGFRIEVHDQNDPANEIVSDESLDWLVTVDPSGDADVQTQEGAYNNYALNPGAYTCTVKNDSSTADWYPAGTVPGTTTDSFTCTVTSNTVTTYARNWVQASDCFTSATTGVLWVNVTDPTGAPLSGASVDPAPGLDNANPDPGAVTTNANGDALFNSPGIGYGWWNVSLTESGYVSQVQAYCLESPTTDQANLNVTLTQASGGTTTATITLTYTGGGNQVFRVTLGGQVYTYKQEQTLSSKKGAITYSFSNVTPGTYDVQISCKKGKNYNLESQGATGVGIQPPGYSNSFTLSKC